MKFYDVFEIVSKAFKKGVIDSIETSVDDCCICYTYTGSFNDPIVIMFDENLEMYIKEDEREIEKLEKGVEVNECL